jgi:hypothetical protein
MGHYPGVERRRVLIRELQGRLRELLDQYDSMTSGPPEDVPQEVTSARQYFNEWQEKRRLFRIIK